MYKYILNVYIYLNEVNIEILFLNFSLVAIQETTEI